MYLIANKPQLDVSDCDHFQRNDDAGAFLGPNWFLSDHLGARDELEILAGDFWKQKSSHNLKNEMKLSLVFLYNAACSGDGLSPGTWIMEVGYPQKRNPPTSNFAGSRSA